MAKKTESSFINMFLSLLIFTAIGSFALAGVYNLTKEPIAKVEKLKKESAIKQVIQDFDTLVTETVSIPDQPRPLGLTRGYRNDSIVGSAIQTYSLKGYSGLIELMVGFDTSDCITKIEVLQQKETPGLGTKMETPEFKEQFYGKDPSEFKLKVKKDGGDVDAITAATISSRAFCDAVQRAYDTYKNEGGK
ncbi:MAG: RnfABCDGE type electron transport complex subunit G [Bacteroidales bacterium]|nr:RnfABCDGE type electron transport complex subunit G [Lentimicrobiaceae bacterium]MDD5695345.1 RnfABCDGE type electron transport complex subunit G [Bacteroidales bacterium]